SSVSSPPPPEPSPLTLATLAEQLVLLVLPFAICTLVGQERLSTSQPRRRHDRLAGARASIWRMRWLSTSISSLLLPSSSVASIVCSGVSPSSSVSFSSAPQSSRSSTAAAFNQEQAMCSGVSSYVLRTLTLAPPSNKARIVPID
ncbi:unnamed protein product, partial [Ectocarpus fasciculatus]